MDGPWAAQYKLEETDENGNGVLDPVLDEEGNPIVDQTKLNRYQFNRIERTTDLDLNWDLATFRSYDPAIGRWVQVDPLAELADDITPYRFGFNNPLGYVDPFGLFESEGEARRYKKEQRKKGNRVRGRVREQKDGTYAIENRKNRSFTARDSEFGIITGALVTAPKDGVNNMGTEALPAYVERTTSYTGFWGGAYYYLTGGEQNGLLYNRDGYPLRVAPQASSGALALIGGGGVQAFPKAAQLFNSGSKTVRHTRGNLYMARTGKWLNPSGNISYGGGLISSESKLLSITSKYDFNVYRGVVFRPYVAPQRQKKLWELFLEGIGRSGGDPNPF